MNDDPPPKDDLTTTPTTAAAVKEGGDDKNVGAKDGNNDDKAGYDKGGEEGGGKYHRGGGYPAAKDGNYEDNKYDKEKDDNKEDVMDILPPLVSRRVERLKHLNMERERGQWKYIWKIERRWRWNIWIYASLYTRREGTLSPDVWMTRSRGFINREGERRRRRCQRETTTATPKMRGRDRRGRGPHPWRISLTMMISMIPSPPDRVLILLTSKTMPSMTMPKRGAWWKYLSSGYAQWDTWRPYPN